MTALRNPATALGITPAYASRQWRLCTHFMTTPIAHFRKLLVTVLIAVGGTLDIQAASPSDTQAGPEIIRSGDGQVMVSVTIGPTNSEVQWVPQANPKEPVVIRGTGSITDHGLSRAALPILTIEDRLNRVEGEIESERREVNGAIWTMGVAVVSICILGLGLLAARYKS